MKVAYGVNEFVNLNDKEIRRILSFIVVKVDSDLIEDLAQNFYLLLIKNDILGKFDRTVPNIGPFFAKYIYRSIKNSVYGYMSNRNNVGDFKWCTRVATSDSPDLPETDILEILPPKNNGVCGRSGTLSLNVDPLFDHSLVGSSFQEEEFMEMIESFEKEILGSEDLSTRTRELYYRYLVGSKSGVKPKQFTSDEDITATYVTSIRKNLKQRFKHFRDKYEGGVASCY